MSEREATGFKKRLEEAKSSSKRIKLWFQYPNSIVSIKKSGIVKEVYDDSFTIIESFDGECTFSYSFLVEISEEKLDDWRRDNGPRR
jgi:hypothetical protein